MTSAPDRNSALLLDCTYNRFDAVALAGFLRFEKGVES